MITPLFQYILGSGVETLVPDSMANYKVYQASVIAIVLLAGNAFFLKARGLNPWSGVNTLSKSGTYAIGVAICSFVGTMLILSYLMTRISFMMSFGFMNLFYAGIISIVVMVLSSFITYKVV